jgi:hypothetical protein
VKSPQNIPPTPIPPLSAKVPPRIKINGKEYPTVKIAGTEYIVGALNWNGFLDMVRWARNKLGITDHAGWYRGLPSVEYSLTPKLLRRAPPDPTKIRLEERRMYHRYVYSLYAAHEMSWHNLVMLQHHGAPTRLLDWTESFAVALFFALNSMNEAQPESPCMWILNPYKLARDYTPESLRKTTQPSTWLEAFFTKKDRDYQDCFLERDCWPYETPMPLVPPTPTARIRAQQGYFTIHGNGLAPLETQCPNTVAQIPLGAATIHGAREFLELAGVTRCALFPDIDGFARDACDSLPW